MVGRGVYFLGLPSKLGIDFWFRWLMESAFAGVGAYSRFVGFQSSLFVIQRCRRTCWKNMMKNRKWEGRIEKEKEKENRILIKIIIKRK